MGTQEKKLTWETPNVAKIVFESAKNIFRCQNSTNMTQKVENICPESSTLRSTTVDFSVRELKVHSRSGSAVKVNSVERSGEGKCRYFMSATRRSVGVSFSCGQGNDCSWKEGRKEGRSRLEFDFPRAIVRILQDGPMALKPYKILN